MTGPQIIHPLPTPALGIQGHEDVGGGGGAGAGTPPSMPWVIHQGNALDTMPIHYLV